MAVASLMTAGRPVNHIHDPVPLFSNPVPPSASSPTDLSEFFRTWSSSSSATVKSTDMSFRWQEPSHSSGYQDLSCPVGSLFAAGGGTGQVGQQGPPELPLEADDLKPEMDSLAMGIPEIDFHSLDFPNVTVSKPNLSGYGGSGADWNRQHMGQQGPVVGQRVAHQQPVQQGRAQVSVRGATHQDAQCPRGDFGGHQRAYSFQNGSPNGGARFTPPSTGNSPVAAAQAAIRGSFHMRSLDHGRSVDGAREATPSGAGGAEARGGRPGTSSASMSAGIHGPNVHGIGGPAVARKTSPAAMTASPGAQAYFNAAGSAGPSNPANAVTVKSSSSPPMGSPGPGPSHAALKRSFDSTFSYDGQNNGPAPQKQTENRRVNHINAEHKRRCNIKNGFDTLQQLIPALQQRSASQKVSKAAMLHKAADLIKQLKQERQDSQGEVEKLRAQIDALTKDIAVCQSQLPDTGAPVVRHKTSKVMDMYRDFVKQKTLQDWKFWIFSTIADPMADSFNNSVSAASFEDMCRTTLSWAEQHCSLITLRPSVLGSLRHLSTNTSILSNPGKLPEEAARAVTKIEVSGELPTPQTLYQSRSGTLSHQSSSSSSSSMS